MAQTLGDFELLDQIGRGGMGVVYRARQTSLEREVAVKVLPPELATQGHVAERFQAEARRMAKLSHPHIAQIYTVGEQDGTHYFAMQLLPGGTLEDRLKRGPLGIEEACKIAAEVADALEHAHAQGLTHRDIKPANIMFDAQGHAVVTDFGIAKAADDVRLTATGMAVGTPQYMAPEQARGNPTDHRADIYALGAVMYEMVCGRPPFSGDTPVSIAMKHMSETPLPPQAFRGDVPEWLQSVILKALAKEPADRFASAGDMARALAAQVAVGAPPPPPPPGPPSDHGATRVLDTGNVTGPRPAQALPTWVVPAIGVLLVLGIGLIAGGVLGKERGKGAGSGPLPPDTATIGGGGSGKDTPRPVPPTIKVPQVVGLTEADAEERLRGDGFGVDRKGTRYDEFHDKGTVASQHPAAGVDPPPDRVVAIVTSLGPEPRPEPEPYDGPQEGEGGSSQSVEDAVQQVVFDLHRAIENHSADSALACFASGAKGKPSRSDFTRAEGYGNTRTSSPRNFRGFWSNGDTAGITCDIYYEDYDGKSGTVGHRYGFRRVGGTWRISSKQGT